jgi:hypothetical protein
MVARKLRASLSYRVAIRRKSLFDDVASLVCALVGVEEGYSVGLVRYDRFCATINDVGADVVAVITLIGDEGMPGGASAGRAGAATMSASWPGVRWNAQGLQSGSLSDVDFRGASAA